MKKIIVRYAFLAVLLGAIGLGHAQSTGHYPAGSEGIKGSSLPPPGVYLKDYNIFYWADRFPVGGPPNFEATLYVNAPRLIWITDWKLLGAYYGMDLIVPFYYGKTKFAGSSQSTFTLGDIQIEPITLSWHLKQFDFAVGYAIWAPTGDHASSRNPFDRPQYLLGKGFWTHMFTAGGTWYVDKEKTWALSLLNRYEIHHEHVDMDYTAGNHLTLEWGLSKALSKTIDLGLVGYYQQQVTEDSGSLAGNAYSRVIGAGPELSVFCPKMKLFTSLRYVREFGARYRPEGNTFTLTLTKIF